MTVLGRLTRSSALRSFRTIISHKTPTTQRFLHHHRYSEKHCVCCGSQVLWQRVMNKDSNSESNSYSVYLALLAGLFGAGTIETAYADANEANGKPDVVSDSPSSYANLEDIARKEKKRIDEMLWNKGIRSYPRCTVGVKGQKVSIKFQVSPTCEVSQLIAKLVSKLGLTSEDGGGSYMVLRAWDSSVAWQLTLNSQERQKKSGNDKDTNIDEGDLCILFFRSLITSDKAEVEFMKQGSLSLKELDALVSVLQLAGGKLPQSRSFEDKPRQGTAQMPSAEKLITDLEAMGVRIYGVNKLNDRSSNAEISWKNIAGYDKQKRDMEDTILLALQSPDIYDNIARGTRCKFESNRPRAVLFEGPPGTGKTSCARVIATQAGVPLLYVPLEVVMSKYYGESERLMGKVFSLANELQDGALIFLDEVDAFAVARDSEMHEATRRMLSVLLRQIDGFEQDKRVIVIAATNRKQDLDPALISRFDSIITFGLPDQENRREIAAQYAKHLTKSELVEFAKITEAMSGRDIRDVCQQAERQWASKIIRGQVSIDRHLPPLEEYIECAENRKKALRSIEEQKDRNPMVSTKKHQLDFCSAN